jgi:hypothetical protein
VRGLGRRSGGSSEIFTIPATTAAGTVGGVPLVDITTPIGAAVPELGNLSLLGMGTAAIAAWRRWNQRRKS